MPVIWVGSHRRVFLPSTFCHSVREMVPHDSPKRDNKNRFGELSFSLRLVNMGGVFYPGFPSCGRAGPGVEPGTFSLEIRCCSTTMPFRPPRALCISMVFTIGLPVKSSSSGGRRNLPKTVAAMTANVTDLLGQDSASALSARVPPRGSKCSHCQISWQVSCRVLLACCSTTCCHFPVVLTTAKDNSTLVVWHSVSRKCSSSRILTWRTPSADHNIPLCWKAAV